jgi:hypothetical protein
VRQKGDMRERECTIKVRRMKDEEMEREADPKRGRNKSKRRFGKIRKERDRKGEEKRRRLKEKERGDRKI